MLLEHFYILYFFGCLIEQEVMKMLKKFTRKALSLLLVFVLLATTFFIFDPSILLPESKAYLNVTDMKTPARPTVHFRVPETIYLKYGAKDFQYYVDSKTDGTTLNTDAAKTTGQISFSSSISCSSITISYSYAGSVTLSALSATNTQSFTPEIRGGSAISASAVDMISWTVTYVCGGVTFKSYAYTYVYPPNGTIVGSGADGMVKGTSHRGYSYAMALLTGGHSLPTTTVTGAQNGSYSFKGNTTSTASGGWTHPLLIGIGTNTGMLSNYPIARGYMERLNTQTNGGVNYTYSANRDDLTERVDYNQLNSAESTIPAMSLTVDKSRYTNTNQIPNLQAISYAPYIEWGGKTSRTLYVARFTGTSHKSNMLNDYTQFSTSADYNNDDGTERNFYYSTRINSDIPTNYSSYNIGIMEYFFYRYTGFWDTWDIKLNVFADIKVTVVDKSALRTKYREYSDYAISTDKGDSVPSGFATAFKEAGRVLGKPDATATEITSALSGLNTAANKPTLVTMEETYTGYKVNFYVPETIYLNPSDNRTFQFFYGTDKNGNVTQNTSLSTASAGAMVYFSGENCSPTDLKITVSASTSTYSAGATSHNWQSTGTYVLSSMTINGTTQSSGTAIGSTGWSFSGGTTGDNVKLTAGSFGSSYSVTAGQVRFLLWTAEYKIDGVTYKAYAFTSCYAPYDKPAFASTRAKATSHCEVEAHSIAWIVGMTSCNTGGGRSNNVSGFDPIRGVITTPTTTTSDNSGNGVVWQDSATYHSASSSNDTGTYSNSQTSYRHAMAYAQAPTGQLVLDSTRFSNLQYVPNLKTGYLISAIKEGSDTLNQRNISLYASEFTSSTPSWTGSGSYTNDDGSGGDAASRFNDKGTVLTSFDNTSTEKAGADTCGPRMVWNNKEWNVSISSTKTIYFKGAVMFHVKDKGWGAELRNAWNSCIVPLNVTVVNKSSLRKKVHDLTNNMYQQDFYSNTTEFNTYMNQLCNAYVEMANPASTKTTATITEPSTRKSGTATAYHKSTKNTGNKLVIYNPSGTPTQQIVTETKSYKYGDGVFADYNDYVGYERDHCDPTKLTITSASSSAYTWNFWYKPIEYNINYNLNGGTVSGTNPSTYTIEDSFTLINPTKTGYTFVGWSGTDIDGMSMSVTVPVGSIGDRSYVANFEPNTYTLLYDNEFDFDKWAKSQYQYAETVNTETEYKATSVLEGTGAGTTDIDLKAKTVTLKPTATGTTSYGTVTVDKYTTFSSYKMQLEAGVTYTLYFDYSVKDGGTASVVPYVFFHSSQTSGYSPYGGFATSGTGNGTIACDFTVPDSYTYVSFRFTIVGADQVGKEVTYSNIVLQRKYIYADNGFDDEIALGGIDTSNSTRHYESGNNITLKWDNCPQNERYEKLDRIYGDGMAIEETTDLKTHNNVITYDGSFSKDFYLPRREGYTFAGWYKTPNCTAGTELNYTDTVKVTDTLKVYSKWISNTYKLMYENEFDFDSVTYTNGNGLKDITADYANNTLSMTSTATNCYISDGSTRMKLIGGHTYKVTFNFTSTNGGKSRCTIMPYSAASGGTWGSAYYIENLSSGGTFTVNENYPYVFLRFGISCTSTGIDGTFSDIHVQDLTDPMGYKSSDGISPSLDKKFDDVTFNTTQSPLATISRQGYSFNGWYQSQNTSNGNGYGTEFEPSTKMPAKDVPLYAQWTLNDYSVTINLNADSTDMATIGSFDYSKANNNTTNGNISLTSAPSSQQTSAGNITTIYVAYGTSFTLPIPSRDGYVFTGWTASTTPAYASLTNNGETSASAYRVGEGNVTLTAHWTENTFTIKFNGNGNTNTTVNMSDQTFAYNKAQNLTANAFKKEYTVTFNGNGGTVDGQSVVTTTAAWDFSGWNNAANGSGSYNYTNSQSVTNPCGLTEQDSSATLYAQWTGGNLNLKTATRANYTFIGWALDSNAETPTYTVNQNVNFTKNMTFYAVWVETATANKRVETIDVVSGITVTSTDLDYDAIIESTKKYVFANDETYSSLCVNYENALSNFNSSKTIANATALVNARKALNDTKYSVDKFAYDAPVKNFIREFDIEYASGVTGAVEAGKYKLSDLNLNHYTTEVLSEDKDSILKQVNIAEAVTSISNQSTINEAVKKIAKNFLNKKKVTTTPAYKVYENADAAMAAKDAGENKIISGTITAMNYVYAGKGNYTYYCYTNSTSPTILMTVNDIAGSTGRVCYPTKAETVSLSATGSGNAVAPTFKQISVANETYLAFAEKEIGYGSTEIPTLDYYKKQTAIELQPTFTENENGTVVYKLKAYDDAYGANYATMSQLTNGNATDNALSTIPQTAETAENTITIIVNYHSGNQMNVTAEQVDPDVCLKQYHLFRTAGGATNWELPKKTGEKYSVNDPVYGQTDTGSFTYTFTLGSANDETAAVINDTDGYIESTSLGFVINPTTTVDTTGVHISSDDNFTTKAESEMTEKQKALRTVQQALKGKFSTAKVFSGTISGGDGLGLWEWGNNWSYNYYPKSEAYTYVHIIDRWGNVYEDIFWVGKQDAKPVSSNPNSSSAGAYEILEAGGSGIDTLSLNAASMEILTDESSTLENNVYKTTGNTVKIKTGEANKSYTLTMKDKATNASTATLTSDENGIITLNVTDEAYTSGVYTFMLNDIEINLYDAVNNDKYIVKVNDGEAEEGSYAELSVVTTGEVGKVRFTDTDGNTITIASCEKNTDGTKTWKMSKKRAVGEYKYSISVKVGYNWIEESSKGTLTFTAKILDSGVIRSAEYDAETGLYKITIEGRATKIQFITEDGMTRTYTRYNEFVKSKKTYDAEGNEVNDTARTLDHEIWLVDAKLYSGLKYTVAGKFEAGWNMNGTATMTAH